MKLVYYANGKTMVGSKNARDLSEKNLRKVIELIVSAVRHPDIAVDMDKVERTKIDLIKIINSFVAYYGKYYENTKEGGYDIVLNLEQL